MDRVAVEGRGVRLGPQFLKLALGTWTVTTFVGGLILFEVSSFFFFFFVT